jgi:hypothetical protein
MRGRLKNQAFTPKDWLPVAAAIGADANERVSNRMGHLRRRAADEAFRAARSDAFDDAAGAYRADELEDAKATLRAAHMRADAAQGRLRDLAVHVGPGATMGTGAPAFYREADREIVLDSAVALPGVDPASVRWDDPLWRAEHLRAAGLVEHGLGAAHTPGVCASGTGRACNVGVRTADRGNTDGELPRPGWCGRARCCVAHELILRSSQG